MDYAVDHAFVLCDVGAPEAVLVLRPAVSRALPTPFPSAPGLEGPRLAEHAVFYLPFPTPRNVESSPSQTEIQKGELTSLTIELPAVRSKSRTRTAIEASGLVRFVEAEGHRLHLVFGRGGRGTKVDLAPALPVTLGW